MGGVYSETVLEELAAGVQGLLPEWGLSGTLRLLTISENATYLLDGPHGRTVFRVHRPGYHTEDEIRSELAWIEALRAQGIVETPAILPTRDGARVRAFDHGDELRHVVAFAFAEGVEPRPGDDLVPGFRTLGGISARLHGHVRGWDKPAGFVRKTWTFDTIAGDRPHWGQWQAALGLTPDGRAVLDRLAAALDARLAAWGTGPERFGLIHADLRLANLLVREGGLTVIDFDDCGFGWFGFDFAAAVSFMEDAPEIPALMDAWVEGYRAVAPLGDADAAMLPTFVMLRRLQLTAWIASHAETPTAQEFGDGFTDGTVMLAERYLST